MSDYDHLTNADVMSADELAEYDRDAELWLDAQDEARDAAAAAEELAEAGDDDAEDCGAASPDDECGMCDGCREAEGDDIEAQFESGSITFDEAVSAHELNGTWG